MFHFSDTKQNYHFPHFFNFSICELFFDFKECFQRQKNKMTNQHDSSILKFILLLIGGFLLLWGIFCLLGGPDGRVGSTDSLLFGGGFTLAGIISLYFRELIKRKLKK